MEISSVKSVGVFIVIIACFTVLYPKIFHPVVMHVFGYKSTPQDSEAMLNRIPPHLRRSMTQSMHAHQEDSAQERMRPPHPGLRAAAEMKKQAAPPSGMGGKGLMSVVLPLYAVGIVVYLVYTLSKVFGKGDSVSPDYLSDNNPFSNAGHEIEKMRGSSSANDNYEYGKNKNDDFERLLLRADERKITDDELQLLKKRLVDTENQMSRILQAMNQVQTNVESLEEVVPPKKNVVDQDEDNALHGYDLHRTEAPNLQNIKSKHEISRTCETLMSRIEDLGIGEDALHDYNFHRTEAPYLPNIKSKHDISRHCEHLMSRIEDLGIGVDISGNESNDDKPSFNEEEHLSDQITRIDAKDLSDSGSIEHYSDSDIINDDCDCTSIESFPSNTEFENHIVNNESTNNDLRQRKKHIAVI